MRKPRFSFSIMDIGVSMALHRRAGRQDVLLLVFMPWNSSPIADKNSPLVLGSGSEGKYKKAGLITHDRSQSHRRVEAAHKTQRGPMDTVIEKMTNEKTVVLNNLFNTATLTDINCHSAATISLCVSCKRRMVCACVGILTM